MGLVALGMQPLLYSFNLLLKMRADNAALKFIFDIHIYLKGGERMHLVSWTLLLIDFSSTLVGKKSIMYVLTSFYLLCLKKFSL